MDILKDMEVVKRLARLSLVVQEDSDRMNSGGGPFKANRSFTLLTLNSLSCARLVFFRHTPSSSLQEVKNKLSK
jgi:hypothetical protein